MEFLGYGLDRAQALTMFPVISVTLLSKFKMFIYRMLERNVKMTADKIKTYIAINANFLKSLVVT